MSATSAHETGVPVTALCPPIEALLLCPSETNLWQEAKDTSRAEALHSDLQVLPRRFEAHPFPRDALGEKRHHRGMSGLQSDAFWSKRLSPAALHLRQEAHVWTPPTPQPIQSQAISGYMGDLRRPSLPSICADMGGVHSVSWLISQR